MKVVSSMLSAVWRKQRLENPHFLISSLEHMLIKQRANTICHFCFTLCLVVFAMVNSYSFLTFFTFILYQGVFIKINNALCMFICAEIFFIYYQ